MKAPQTYTDESSLRTRALPGCVQQPLGTAEHCSQNGSNEILEEELAAQAQSKAHTAMSLEQFKVNLEAARPLTSLLFLDVDGVLNNESSMMRVANSDLITSDTPMMILNRQCLRRLVGLIVATGARLVLSSTWRESWELKADLWAALVAEGLPCDAFVGQTDWINMFSRPFEIEAWRDNHPREFSADWAVVDDMPLGKSEQLAGHFVWIDPKVGLSDKDVAIASRILRGSMSPKLSPTLSPTLSPSMSPSMAPSLPPAAQDLPHETWNLSYA